MAKVPVQISVLNLPLWFAIVNAVASKMVMDHPTVRSDYIALCIWHQYGLKRRDAFQSAIFFLSCSNCCCSSSTSAIQAQALEQQHVHHSLAAERRLIIY